MEDKQILHCLTPPSYLGQLMKCSKSLNRDPLAIDDDDEASANGTFKHALARAIIAQEHGLPFDNDDFSSATSEDEEQVRVVQDFVNFYIARLRKRYAVVEIFLEERVELNDYLPNPAWGFADIVLIAHRKKPNKDGIYNDSTIVVLDEKYGRVEVPVYTKDGPNPQLSAYWAGLYERFKDKYEITRGVIGIIQPVIKNYPTFQFRTQFMTDYVKNVISPIAYEAYEDRGSYKPSPSNCLYCKNKIHCKHNIAQLIAFNQLVDKPDMLDDSVIEDLILPFANSLKKQCDAILNYCLKRAEEGKTWRGFALSTGRPTRVYTDESEAKRIALDNGYKDFVVESILSPAQAEKLLGKTAFKELLGSLVTYKPGKNTLVPEADAKGTSKNFINQENK
jgi:hypothetical protein